MSNKLLLALFACGVVAVGSIALKNKTDEQIAVDAVGEAAEDDNCPTVEGVEAEVAPEATVDAVVTEVIEEEAAQ